MNDKRTVAQPVSTAVTPRERDKNPPPPPPGKSERAMDTGNHAPVVEVKRLPDVPVTTPTVEGPAAAPAPAPGPVVLVAGELTREQKLSLFEAAFAAEKDVVKAEEAVTAASLVLSEKIKTLITALGGKQGPWNVLGERGLRARFRGDVAYFLRESDKVETI